MTDPVTGTLRLTQPTVGGDAGTWGAILNSNLAYTDTAINGIVAITLSGTTYTLDATGDSGDQARSEWYSFSGSIGANCTVTLPANTKIGIASNGTTGGHQVILSTGSGNTVSIDPGSTVMFYCDGTNINLVPWGSPGTLPALLLTGATTITTAEKGSYVEVALTANATIGLPTPVGNAGDSYLINFLTGTYTATLSTPAGAIIGGYGSGTNVSAYVTGPVFQIISDGTNWVTQGNAAVAATTISATGAVTFGSTLNVTGSSSFTGNSTFAGNVTVTGTLNAGVVSGTATATSLAVTGTATIAGTATMGSALDVVGTATAAVVDVTGTSSLIGNVTLGANEFVTGTDTMAVLDVTGTSSHVGNATFGANITVTGTATEAALDVTGTSTMAVLDVTGTSSMVGNVIMAGTATASVLDVTGTSSQVGNATFGANVVVTGTETMAVLDVTGTSTQAGAAKFGASVTVVGTVTEAGEVNSGTSTIGTLIVSGTSSQAGNAIYAGTVTAAYVAANVGRLLKVTVVNNGTASTGNYTAVSSAAYMVITMVGAGGGGGGAATTGTGANSVGGGGASGAYCWGTYATTTSVAWSYPGASAGGTGGNKGTDGGAVVFGTMTASGGQGGGAAGPAGGNFYVAGGTANPATGGIVNQPGFHGNYGNCVDGWNMIGYGAYSRLGGTGGDGVSLSQNLSAIVGNSGGAAFLMVEEYG